MSAGLAGPAPRAELPRRKGDSGPPAWLYDWAGTPQRYDLLILLPNLGRGGAQRVASTLANAWAGAGYRVCVGTFSDKTEDAHQLVDGVTRLKVREFLRAKLEGSPPPSAATAATERAVLATRLRERPRSGAARPGAGSSSMTAAEPLDPSPLAVDPCVPAPIVAPTSAASTVAAAPLPDAKATTGLMARLRALKRNIRRAWREATFPLRQAGRLLRRWLRDLKRTARRRIHVALFPARQARRAIRRQLRGLKRTPSNWGFMVALPLAPVALFKHRDHLRGAWQSGRALRAAHSARQRPLGALRDYQDILRDRAKCRHVLAARLLMQHTRAPVILAFLGSTNVTAALARHGLASRLVISERNDPARQQLQEPYETLRPLAYGLADIVTANSQGAIDTMRAYVDGAKLVQVANPLVVPQAPGDRAPGADHAFITVSRLVPQKRVDRIIQAFARIVASGDAQGWRLDILGDGPERESLEALAARLGIADHVRFHGHVEPFARLYEADVFVLFSSYEGLPNALLEAMACGLTPVVNDGSPGPLEYVQHEATGLVVSSDDVEDLASTMRRLAGDPALRARLSAAARERVGELGLDRILASWNRVLGLALTTPAVPVTAGRMAATGEVAHGAG
jgi:glycosyltransferase involved in cell wall biosynthesis